MPSTIREQIILAVQTAVGTIVGLDKCYLNDGQAPGRPEGRCVVIYDLGDTQRRRHVRGAYENKMLLKLRLVNREPDPATQTNETNSLDGDVMKKLVADETWGGLAVSTEAQAAQHSLDELGAPMVDATIDVEIKYRVSRTDPYAVKAI